jgi:hypothetical protein
MTEELGGGKPIYLQSEIGQALQDGCLFYCDADDNTIDKLGNFSQGVPTDVTYDAQINNNGFVFDGVSSRVTFDDTANILDNDGTAPMSWSFWIDRANNSNESYLSRGGNTSHTGIGWTIMTNGGDQLYFQMNATSGYPTDELQCFAYTTAHASAGREHVVITYDGSKDETGVKFYVNGSLKTTNAGANNLSGNDPSNDGADFVIGGCSTTDFEGDLDEISIYDFELTQDHVDYLYGNALGSNLKQPDILGLPTVATAVASQIPVGVTAWANGLELVGTGQAHWNYASLAAAESSGDPWTDGDTVEITGKVQFLYKSDFAVNGYSGLVHKYPFDDAEIITGVTLDEVLADGTDPDTWGWTDAGTGSKGTDYEYDTSAGDGRIRTITGSGQHNLASGVSVAAENTSRMWIIDDLVVSHSGSGNERLYMTLSARISSTQYVPLFGVYTPASTTNYAVLDGSPAWQDTGIALAGAKRIWCYLQANNFVMWVDDNATPDYTDTTGRTGTGTAANTVSPALGRLSTTTLGAHLTAAFTHS